MSDVARTSLYLHFRKGLSSLSVFEVGNVSVRPLDKNDETMLKQNNPVHNKSAQRIRKLRLHTSTKMVHEHNII